MGKRKSCRKQYISKGERKNVSNKHSFNLWGPVDRALFKAEAKRKGKRVYETISNPNKLETNKKFIRVLING